MPPAHPNKSEQLLVLHKCQTKHGKRWPWWTTGQGWAWEMARMGKGWEMEVGHGHTWAHWHWTHWLGTLAHWLNTGTLALVGHTSCKIGHGLMGSSLSLSPPLTEVSCNCTTFSSNKSKAEMKSSSSTCKQMELPSPLPLSHPLREVSCNCTTFSSNKSKSSSSTCKQIELAAILRCHREH